MNPQSSLIKNPCALRWLVIIIGLLLVAGWTLWKFRAPDADPPLIAFIAIAMASLILFDDCKE